MINRSESRRVESVEATKDRVVIPELLSDQNLAKLNDSATM